ncbi:MAG: GDP-mannose 4,6-dehydratase [Longimicrobiales bacterium]
MTKTALITGISGQDGAYLAALLLGQGYKVVGAARRSASGELWRLRELGVEPSVTVVDLELAEYANVEDVVKRVQPTEVYNLAAQSFVGTSFDMPIFTSDVNALGTLRVLEALRRCAPEARFYQASTSEMFGKVRETPQTEDTPFYPRSPYGVSKVFGHWATVNYREAWNLFACSGILFNHESPLRGREFVTRKITLAVAKRATTGEGVLQLGNLDGSRDWGFAGDYVEAMWRMLQVDRPADYVIATGVTHTVRTFVERAYASAGIDIEWEGEGVTEKGRDAKAGSVVVEVSKDFFRPAEVDVLIGDASRARRDLGFRASVTFDQLVEMMVRRDIERMR